MLRYVWPGVLWAMERRLRESNPAICGKIEELRVNVRRECCGLSGRLTNAVVGPAMLWATRREAARLKHGVTYEPETIVQQWPPANAPKHEQNPSQSRIEGYAPDDRFLPHPETAPLRFQRNQ
jgi:hypothetical protein